ncbi:MAG: AI-2E family transporter, partial [Dorea sp.]
MELNVENVKKIKEIILFTVIAVACLWKYDVVLRILKFVLDVVFPFILGGAIAFVLNVPMNFIQRHLFNPERIKDKKIFQKFARPVSLVLTIVLVIGVVGVVMFVLIPQLADTFVSLGSNVKVFMPKVQRWATALFHDNKEIMVFVNNMDFDWNSIVNVAVNFFKSGAGSVLDSTIVAAKSIVSGLGTFFIAVVFAIYILIQKEKLNIQSRKVLFAFVRKGRAEAALEVFSLTYSTFSSFLTGQCVEAIILGCMFVVVMSILKLPYALLVGIVIAFTALIPIFGAFIGCVIGAFLIFMVNPFQ